MITSELEISILSLDYLLIFIKIVKIKILNFGTKSTQKLFQDHNLFKMQLLDSRKNFLKLGKKPIFIKKK